MNQMTANGRVNVLRNVLQVYADGLFQTGVMARLTLRRFDTEPLTDPVERHLVTYLRWYAAGNQDGGACARVALEIAFADFL